MPILTLLPGSEYEPFFRPTPIDKLARDIDIVAQCIEVFVGTTEPRGRDGVTGVEMGFYCGA